MLSKYNPQTGATRFAEKQANEEIATRIEKATVLDGGNKENW